MSRILGACLTLALALPGVANAQTYVIRPIFVCHEDPALGAYCGFSSQQAVDDWMLDVTAEINREFQPSGVSFHPTGALFYQNDAWADVKDSKNPAIPDMLASVAAINPLVVPVVFTDGGGSLCWNGIPALDEKPGFGQDDMVICGTSPWPHVQTGAPVFANSWGRSVAHEIGHFWSLRHTHTKADVAGLDPGEVMDRDGDDCKDGLGVTPADSVCFPGTAIGDTPADPAPQEDSDVDGNGDPKKDHEWCEFDVVASDPGSTQPKACEVTCYKHENGMDVVIPFSPMTENVLAYYGACRGPYTLDGVPHPSLTEDQVNVIRGLASLVPERAALYDRCASFGLDADQDGWCGDEDLCPGFPNARNGDADHDGIGDECDTCPDLANVGDGDNDLDQIGDDCDLDDDNDGCQDWEDQHPQDGQITADHSVPSKGDVVVWEDESEDLDGDLFPNCIDADDDNDGTADEDDPCIIAKDESVCHPKEGPTFSAWLDFCDRTDCEDYVIKIIPPCDPLQEWDLGGFEAVDGVLYLRPLSGRSMSESALAVAGELDHTLAGFKDDGERLLVATSARGEQIPLLKFEVGDGTVRTGDLRQGTLLRVAPDREGRVDVSAVWRVGGVPGERLADADEDRIPDIADNCTEDWNADQLDADRDGFGDGCDADFDQDGQVTERDLAVVEACQEVDLATFDAAPVCEDEGVEPRRLADVQCDAADLNGDWWVDRADLEIARSWLGAAPGPSAKERGER